jgi:hypothetical protein
MTDQDTEPNQEGQLREDDRNEAEGSPVPAPEAEPGDAEDVPEAD